MVQPSPDSWDDYRRRRLLFFVALIGFAPVVFVGVLSGWMLGFMYLAPVIAIAWLGFFLYAANRMGSFPCPMCGRPFFTRGFGGNPFVQRCMHCDWRKWARGPTKKAVDSLEANVEGFVSRVAASENVWILRVPAGVAGRPLKDDEKRHVLMFWSDRDYAARLKHHMPESEPDSISLFDFLSYWLTGMEGNDVLAATDWNDPGTGPEVEPSKLRDQLFQAMGTDRVQQYSEWMWATFRKERM